MKRIGWIFFLTAVVFGCPGCAEKPKVEWHLYEPGVMDRALRSGDPVIAYFYAAWCPPCYKLREETFTDERVIHALSSYRRIKFDMSFKHSPKIQALGQKYGIDTYPQILIYGTEGSEKPLLRLRGFYPPEEFLRELGSLRR